MEHFYNEIDGWSEMDRQGILMETLLEKLNLNEDIIIAEIGVYKGRCTALWNTMLIQKNIKYQYFAIDNFLGSEEHQKNINYYEITLKNLDRIKDKIKVIQNDSILESKNYKDDYFDIVYVDGSHDYDSVMSDISHWYPKVKENGFICGDDYIDIWPGVKRAVEESFNDKFSIVGQTQWFVKK